ncbi:hypothetical protein JGI10_00860 [Candidatus Kryptonium thompsonii]|nr:hypothetical protein JGI10_00860 [Candidatus Kryptonium thompsoni]
MKKKRKILISIILGFILFIVGFLITIPVFVINSMVNRHVDFNEIWKAEDFGIKAEHFFC